MAVSLTEAQLEAALGIEAKIAARLLPVAGEMVNRYAPGAPDAVASEAAIRCAGYLAEMPAAAVRSEAVGDVSTTYAASQVSALRHSGAMALLSPWKVRRAGAI